MQSKRYDRIKDSWKWKIDWNPLIRLESSDTLPRMAFHTFAWTETIILWAPHFEWVIPKSFLLKEVDNHVYINGLYLASHDYEP